MTNRLYHLGIIGCGKVAIKHARAVRESYKRLSLTALVDTSTERAEKFARDNKITTATAFESLTDCLSKTNLDIIAITTPSGTHYKLAKEALEAGVHVLIEKPMTMDLDQARELRAIAKAQNRLIVMGHIYRYFPLVGDIKRDIESGHFGRVLSGVVTVRWGHDQAYYDSASWRGTWAQDGGVLMNQTIHALDLMSWLMNAPFKEAQGQIRKMSHEMEAEDYVAAICTLENGAVLQIEGTTNSPEENQMASFYILTEKAEIEAGLKHGKPYLKIIDFEGKKHAGKYIWRAVKDGIKGGLTALKHMAHPHSAIYRDFVLCLDNPGRNPVASADSGVSSVEHVLAIYKSAKQDGIKVSLPIHDFKLEDMTSTFQ